MSDELPDNVVKLLQEIGDLLRERNELAKASLQKYDEASQRQKEAYAASLRQRRRTYWVLVPLLIVALGWFTYTFWVLPRAEEKQMERQMEQQRKWQSDYLRQFQQQKQ